MTKAAHTAILARPRPSAELISVDGLMRDRFVPAPDLLEWIRTNYIQEHAPLYDPAHAHLEEAVIGCLWTNVSNHRHMRRIVGQAELAKNVGARQGLWQRARGEQQLVEWFGEVPDFLLTFDAVHANEVEDAQFCALVDHELTHCAQERDEFGSPRFDRVTGKPKYGIRGHDVEEFVSVVQRFGVEAAGQGAVDFVIAAASGPTIAPVRLAQACGTCMLRAVA